MHHSSNLRLANGQATDIRAYAAGVLSQWPSVLSRLGDSLTKSEWLVLIPLIYALQLAAEVAYRINYAFANPHRTDFLAFYAGAKLLASAPSQLYSAVSQFAIESPIAPALPKVTLFVNAPPTAWALAPVTNVSFKAALAWFLVVSCVALAISGYLLLRLLPNTLPIYTRVLITVAAVGYAGVENLGLGQWGALQLLAVVIAAELFRVGRGFAAGVVAALVMVKPQLGVFILPALLLGRHYRALAGFSLGCVVWAVTSLILVGVSGIGQWLAILNLDYLTQGLASDNLLWPVAFLHAQTFAVLAELVLAAGAFVLVYAVRSHLRDPLVALALALAISFGIAAVAHRWDVEMLALPVILIARWNQGAGVIVALALGLTALVPHTSGLLVVLAVASLAAYWLRGDSTKPMGRARDVASG